MQFLVGRRWVPVPGYAWIFPMEKGTYKIGIGCLSPFKGTGDNLKVPLENILNHYLNLSDYEILDVHGGILRYSPGQTDRYYSHASPLHAIAIGDSVSAINPLGGEGIRHGMHSARVAAKHIQRYLSGKQKSFKAYEKELKTHFGLKWRLSEIFAAIAYGWAPDSWRDRGVKLASHFSAETIMDVLFNYNFARIFKLFRYPSVWLPKR
jgi:flavin-dependent dehydrogenase